MNKRQNHSLPILTKHRGVAPITRRYVVDLKIAICCVILIRNVEGADSQHERRTISRT